MLVTSENLSKLFTGFKTLFNEGFAATPADYKKLAMVVPSNTAAETYTWMGTFPRLREWLGDRIINNFVLHDYTIKNRRFESTFSIDRDNIDDDCYGALTPIVRELGASAAANPTELVFELLAKGFVELGYDKVPFFSDNHQGFDAIGKPIVVSNMQDGDNPAWFLFDTTRPFRPIVYQERIPPRFQSLTKETDEHVIMRNEFIYGVWSRSNAGFGLWQLAFGSKAPLTHENYEAARSAMATLRGDGGRKLNISPSLLTVPRELEGAGRRIVNGDTRVITVSVGNPETEQAVPITNEWKGTAELLATSYL